MHILHAGNIQMQCLVRKYNSYVYIQCTGNAYVHTTICIVCTCMHIVHMYVLCVCVTGFVRSQLICEANNIAKALLVCVLTYFDLP